jgi:hypothetical protein
MSNIFTLENIDNFSEKINIDELYEKKQQYDVNKLALFNKILNRVHVRIRTTSKQKINDRCCWYVVPEIIIGVPKYDQAGCIAYIMDKLQTNGFNIKYIHPNTIFISWVHWVPSYVRTEFKKKTGVTIDEYGNKIEEDNGDDDDQPNEDPNSALLRRDRDKGGNNNGDANPVASKKKTGTQQQYTSISKYKQSGNLIYTQDILDKIGSNNNNNNNNNNNK